MNLSPAPLDAYLAAASVPEIELGRLFARGAVLTIFDVGACEGEESIRYALAFPKARIFAFEPLPANQSLMRKNLSRYGTTTVELVPVALSNESGESAFYVSSGRPSIPFMGEQWNYGNKSSSLLAPATRAPMHGWIEFREQISVPQRRLGDFCRERGIQEIHFLHLDVQGAELLVLEGADEMLPRIHVVWLEVANVQLYRGQPLRQEIERRLAEAGFALARYEDRGEEGDQLYLNRRFRHNRRRIAAMNITRLAQRWRRLLGRIKRAATGNPGS